MCEISQYIKNKMLATYYCRSYVKNKMGNTVPSHYDHIKQNKS